MKLFTAKPCENPQQWCVYDMYQPLPPKPVFFGTMEDAGLVADGLNRREREHSMSESIFDVFDRRLRANPCQLVIYEHEVSKFVDGMVSLSWSLLPDPKGAFEQSVRDGNARYRGVPVFVDRQHG
jgi:hypothetical protein